MGEAIEKALGLFVDGPSRLSSEGDELGAQIGGDAIILAVFVGNCASAAANCFLSAPRAIQDWQLGWTMVTSTMKDWPVGATINRSARSCEPEALCGSRTEAQPTRVAQRWMTFDHIVPQVDLQFARLDARELVMSVNSTLALLSVADTVADGNVLGRWQAESDTSRY